MHIRIARRGGDAFVAANAVAERVHGRGGIVAEAHEQKADSGVPEADHRPGQGDGEQDRGRRCRRRCTAAPPRRASHSTAAIGYRHQDSHRGRAVRRASPAYLAFHGRGKSGHTVQHGKTRLPLLGLRDRIYPSADIKVQGGIAKCRVELSKRYGTWRRPGRNPLRAAGRARAGRGAGPRSAAGSAGAPSAGARRTRAGERYERMRAPFMGGAFPFPVKYGYAAVGRVEAGRPSWSAASFLRCIRTRHVQRPRRGVRATAGGPCRPPARFSPPIWKRRSTPCGTHSPGLPTALPWSERALSARWSPGYAASCPARR